MIRFGGTKLPNIHFSKIYQKSLKSLKKAIFWVIIFQDHGITSSYQLWSNTILKYGNCHHINFYLSVSGIVQKMSIIFWESNIWGIIFQDHRITSLYQLWSKTILKWENFHHINFDSSVSGIVQIKIFYKLHIIGKPLS